VLQRYAYGYDPAGNRRFEQVDDTARSWTHDALNRLVTQAGGGVLRFVGSVNEPAAVTVAGQPATVSSEGVFEAGVPVALGTNTVAVTATDPGGNTATATYAVDVTDDARTFTYDANGNLTVDGTRSFEWDARNQLVAVTVGTHRTEFVYDGLQRRVRQVEKDNRPSARRRLRRTTRRLMCGLGSPRGVWALRHHEANLDPTSQRLRVASEGGERRGVLRVRRFQPSDRRLGGAHPCRDLGLGEPRRRSRPQDFVDEPELVGEIAVGLPHARARECARGELLQWTSHGVHPSFSGERSPAHAEESGASGPKLSILSA
jgi:YD repeat-containing protein